MLSCSKAKVRTSLCNSQQPTITASICFLCSLFSCSLALKVLIKPPTLHVTLKQGNSQGLFSWFQFLPEHRSGFSWRREMIGNGSGVEELYRIKDRLSDLEKALEKKIEQNEERFEKRTEKEEQRAEKLASEIKNELNEIYKKVDESVLAITKINTELGDNRRRTTSLEGNVAFFKKETASKVGEIETRIEAIESKFTQGEGAKKTIQVIVWIFGSISTVAAGAGILYQFLKH
jgi:hypothetical protein